jgi:hypothetical protein
VATGQVMLELIAARQDGNWLRGAAAGVRGLREWDAAEGARFAERFQEAGARLAAALVALALMSPELGAAASQVGDALATGSRARGKRQAQAAGVVLAQAVAELRDAVSAFTVPRRRRWLGSPGAARSRWHQALRARVRSPGRAAEADQPYGRARAP